MRLTRYILYFIIGMLCIGCTQEAPDEPIAFHAQVSDPEAYSALVTVTHNATNRDPYYGFVVEGAVDDIDAEIKRFKSSTPTSRLEEYVHYQRKSVFRITKLSPEKTYTFIVFGMDNKMKLYGEPDRVVFSTPHSDFTAIQNPNWTIQYKGYTVYKDNDYSLISVSVQGQAEERFFLATYTPEQVQALGNIEQLIVDATYDFVKKMNDDVTVEDWIEDSSVRTEGTYFYRYLEEGDYQSYAIGVHADGSPTGHYVCTPVYHVDKYPADELFTRLMGDWTITDCTGKTRTVTFTERKVNKTLWMSGFGGLKNQKILVQYNRTEKRFIIHSGIVNNDITITFSDGTSKQGTLYFVGAYYNQSGSLKPIGNKETTDITRILPEDNGTFRFESTFYVSFEDGTKTYDTGMMYMLDTDEGAAYFGRLMFPCTTQKATN